MRTVLAAPFADTAAGEIAGETLRACVHCGMCNAACPTFRLTGDELDGPRGRIWLVKDVLEGQPGSRLAQAHLDRCLSCRACETVCPSGVAYHRLADIGREALAARVTRPLGERLSRWTIRAAFGAPGRARLAFALGRLARPLLPAKLRAKVPPAPYPGAESPAAFPGRRMALLGGCVQAAAAPHFNAAARRVFARIGIELEESAGCCGALHAHLDDAGRARTLARRNIGAWREAEAVVVASSGCAAFIRDYPDFLADEPEWRAAARAIAARTIDPIEALDKADLGAVRPPSGERLSVHEPCTLRHGPHLGGRIAALLERLGYAVVADPEPDLCCGSAGAYSLIQPELAEPLAEAKIAGLERGAPGAIVTANIGCWMHLGGRTAVPVRHWLEAVEAALA